MQFVCSLVSMMLFGQAWAARLLKRIAPALLLLAMLVYGGGNNAQAQGGVTWDRPFNVSDSPTSSGRPAIVADSYGNVHVFWSEYLGGPVVEEGSLGPVGDTIMYRRWNGSGWTEPLDILAVAGDPLAEFVDATIDAENQIHLVWTGLTRIYYSMAPSDQAYSVHGWSEPQTIAIDSARSRHESSIATDSRGNIHIVYASRGGESGIFHVASGPRDHSWSEPIRISALLRETEVAFLDVRLIVDSIDQLHVVWAASNRNGFGQAIYYTRGDRNGLDWANPQQLADSRIDNGFVEFPSIMAPAENELLLIHGAERTNGRLELLSIDSGMQWGAAHQIVSSMEGMNGFLVPLRDASGRLHLMINMRPSVNQRTGIYYAPRAGLDWNPVTPVAIEEPYGPSAHNMDAVVRLGNEIHVVWAAHATDEIWYVKGVIGGVEQLPAQTAPVTVIDDERLVESSGTAQPGQEGVEEAQQTAPIRLLPGDRQPSRSWLPIGLASFLVIVVIAATLLISARKLR